MAELKNTFDVLPPEMTKAFLMLSSKSGANTNDSNIGAVEYPLFSNK